MGLSNQENSNNIILKHTRASKLMKMMNIQRLLNTSKVYICDNATLQTSMGNIEKSKLNGVCVYLYRTTTSDGLIPNTCIPSLFDIGANAERESDILAKFVFDETGTLKRLNYNRLNNISANVNESKSGVYIELNGSDLSGSFNAIAVCAWDLSKKYLKWNGVSVQSGYYMYIYDEATVNNGFINIQKHVIQNNGTSNDNIVRLASYNQNKIVTNMGTYDVVTKQLDTTKVLVSNLALTANITNLSSIAFVYYGGYTYVVTEYYVYKMNNDLTTVISQNTITPGGPGNNFRTVLLIGTTIYIWGSTRCIAYDIPSGTKITSSILYDGVFMYGNRYMKKINCGYIVSEDLDFTIIDEQLPEYCLPLTVDRGNGDISIIPVNFSGDLIYKNVSPLLMYKKLDNSINVGTTNKLKLIIEDMTV